MARSSPKPTRAARQGPSTALLWPRCQCRARSPAGPLLPIAHIPDVGGTIGPCAPGEVGRLPEPAFGLEQETGRLVIGQFIDYPGLFRREGRIDCNSPQSGKGESPGRSRSAARVSLGFPDPDRGTYPACAALQPGERPIVADDVLELQLRARAAAGPCRPRSSYTGGNRGAA